MGYRMMGRGHATLALLGQRIRGAGGQGTVEYVALILLVAWLMAAVAAATTSRSEGHEHRQDDRRQAQGRDRQVGKKGACRSPPRTIPPGPPRRDPRPPGTAPTMGAVPAPPPDATRARPIGVFDSGVGGLTVLHELLVALPHEDFVYLGDTARFPYGDAHAGRARALLRCEIAEELLARAAKLLVVACNSATAAALPALRERMMQTTLGVDVLGVVQPEAVAGGRGDAQRARSGCSRRRRPWPAARTSAAIAAADPFVDARRACACPDLAPIIQRGFPFDERRRRHRARATARRCARRGSTR